MRHTTAVRVLFSALLAVLLAGAAPAEGPKPPRGFTALFNGKNLTGWHGRQPFDPARVEKMSAAERDRLLAGWTEAARKHWRIRDGELINDGKGACLTTDREYGDIELLLEYRTTSRAVGGVYLRATPRIEVRDRGGETGSGGLPGRAPLVVADRPLGQWNELRILQVGERTTVHLNGKRVVDHARMENLWDRNLPLRRRGPLQLQVQSGEVRWRKLFVREIAADEANRILGEHGSAGFQEVFNGKDFTGWAGPVDNYEVKDGAIVCRPRKGGNIYTKQQFSDFVARLEYRLPPGGNNGLAIRYPGKGQPSQVAMCEVQILDDDAPKYRRLDPRQYNGSAYGMVPAQRGYLRPVGQWNFIETVVRGPRIRVELNGTRILDADLSKVTKYMGGKPHPGKDRLSGHFGFCGHSDPVAFRNIRIRPLDRAGKGK